MAFVENLGAFFNQDDFAVTAILKLEDGGATRSISAIFNTPTQSIEIYNTAIETDNPFLMCRTSDLSGVRNKQKVVVEGKTFTIEKISADGTGVSTIYLK